MRKFGVRRKGKSVKRRKGIPQGDSFPIRLLEAHNNLGNLLAKQGRLLLAYESISKAHKLLPTNARITNNLGYLSQSLGGYRESVRSL